MLDAHYPDATMCRATNRLLEQARGLVGDNADYTECVKLLEAEAGVSLRKTKP